MKYLKKKGGYYYKSHGLGYTEHIYAAGIFDESECEHELKNPSCEVKAIPLSAVSDLQISDIKRFISSSMSILNAIESHKEDEA